MLSTWLVGTFVDGLLHPILNMVKPQELLMLESTRRAAIRAQQAINIEIMPVLVSDKDSKLNKCIERMVSLLQNQIVQELPRHQQHPHARHWSYHRDKYQVQGRNNFNSSGKTSSTFCPLCHVNDRDIHQYSHLFECQNFLPHPNIIQITGFHLSQLIQLKF